MKSVLKQEQKEFVQQLAPLQAQKEEWVATLEREQHEHARKLQELDQHAQTARVNRGENAATCAKTETAEQENRFRQAQAQWKARFEGIRAEQEGIALLGRAAVRSRNSPSSKNLKNKSVSKP